MTARHWAAAIALGVFFYLAGWALLTLTLSAFNPAYNAL